MKDESGEDLTDATNALTDLFRKVLDKKDLTVKVENLKDEKVSSMVTLSEESRRMQDMMKMYGMTGMDPSMFGGQETLILNAKHPLVQYILKNGENDNTSLFCEQLYDLAMISHKPLSPDEMTKFVSRSNQITAISLITSFSRKTESNICRAEAICTSAQKPRGFLKMA